MTTTTTRGHDPQSEPGPSSSPQSRSTPPPLPQSASRLAPARAAADAAFAERMLERLAASDYAAALMAAEALLVHQPMHADALDCAQMARSELRKLYVARLGSLDRVAHLKVGPQGLLALPLDFGAGFLLSRVDGRSTLGEIVEHSGLPPLETLRILSELYLQRVISLD
ncbi:MAG TPA: hypothetical protein VE987_01520 [Polyangiaceae bacterium]|nr:hypothetical protein [Polyangiaceae bacterium]